MYPAFTLGYLMHIYEQKMNYKKILIISSIIYFVMLIFWDTSFWKGTYYSLLPFLKEGPIQISMLIRYFYRIIIGIAGSLMIISLVKVLNIATRESYGHRIFQYIGKNTLGIYLIQTILLEKIAADYINIDISYFWVNNFIIFPMISLLFMFLCLICINIIKHYYITSLLCLGEKPNNKS